MPAEILSLHWRVDPELSCHLPNGLHGIQLRLSIDQPEVRGHCGTDGGRADFFAQALGCFASVHSHYALSRETFSSRD